MPVRTLIARNVLQGEQRVPQQRRALWQVLVESPIYWNVMITFAGA